MPLTDNDPSERLMRRAEAAAYISETFGVSCCVSTLAKLAVIGGGPTYRKFGRYPLYAPSACRAWVQAKLSKPVASTSELAA